MKTSYLTGLLATVAIGALTACVSPSAPGDQRDTQPSAALAWNRVALEVIERAKPTQHQAARLLAHLSLAQYMAARESPDRATVRATIDTASKLVIAGLVPAQAAWVESRSQQLSAHDSAAGQNIARHVLAAAAVDGFANPWTGTLPTAPQAWRSLATPPAPPAYPAIGAMRTWFIPAGDMFRAPPPPTATDTRFATDLAEVRRHTSAPSEETTRVAKFYDMATGTMAAGFWNENAVKLIDGKIGNERRITLILTAMNGAIVDALAACHDTKYAYWVARPSQVDPTIKTLIGVPNHPSYPSNHSCLSTAASRVLAHFFPSQRDRLQYAATEAGRSRVYAGIHYRFDVEAGELIGHKVAQVAVARHAEELARRTNRPIETAVHAAAP